MSSTILPALSIRALCGGGLVPIERDVEVSTDGTVTERQAGRIRVGTIDPQNVRRLSAQLDAAGFDTILVSRTPHRPTPDTRACVLSRISPTGAYSLPIQPDAPVGIGNVLRELLSLTAMRSARGTGQ